MPAIKISFLITINIFYAILCTGISGCKKGSHSDSGIAETSVKPTHPFIQYIGRVDFTDKEQPVYSAPGAYVTAYFKGTACSVLFQDEFKEGKRNYYDAIIDDTLVVKISPEKGTTEYLVAGNLEYKTHKIIFVKRTEASIGKTKFIGFKFLGNIVSPLPLPKKKIEFIGNSISAGYGGDAYDHTPECKEDGWGQPYHNAYLSFPGRIARDFGASYHITAVSGIGIVRNWSNEHDARNMTEVYQNLYLEDKSSPVWQHERFLPDAIVIELGTNDFAVGASPRPKMDSITISEAYTVFIDRLRKIHPNSIIFCVSSPMLSDGFPDPEDRFASTLQGVLKNLEESFKRKGDHKVYAIMVSKVEAQGCDSHPSTAQHEKIAKEIIEFMKPVLKW